MSAGVIAASYVDSVIPSGPLFWLRAASMSALADGALASTTWLDESGNNKHATRTNNGIYYEAASTPKGTDSLRFDPAGGAWYDVASDVFSGKTEVSIFIVLKNTRAAGVENQGPWQFLGGDISFYPYSDNNVYDGAFSNSRTSFALPNPTDWHVYNVTSKTGEWRAYVDNVLKASMSPTFSPGSTGEGSIGRYNTAWGGMVAEIVCYDRVLSSDERTQLHNYLRSLHIA